MRNEFSKYELGLNAFSALVFTLALICLIAGLALHGCSGPPESCSLPDYDKELLPSHTVTMLARPDLGPLEAMQTLLDADNLTFCGSNGHSKIVLCGSGSFAGSGYIVTFDGCSGAYADPMNARGVETFCASPGERR